MSEELTRYRVVLKKEEPETDIKNERGVIAFDKNQIRFNPDSLQSALERTYNISDLKAVQTIEIREFIKKKTVCVLQFERKKVAVTVFFDPIDITANFLVAEIRNYHKKHGSGSLSEVVGSLVEKIGYEATRAIRGFSTLIETSSRELTQAFNQTVQTLREATQTANLLEGVDWKEWSEKRTIELDASEVDEILKRSLTSGNIEAILSGLVAKALVSVRDQKYEEARDALNIARNAARQEKLDNFEKILDQNIQEIDNAETTGTFNPHLDQKALKYANEARDIVADWEKNEDQPPPETG